MSQRATTALTWNEAYTEAADKFRQPLWWYPYPVLLPLGLVLVLTAYLVFATNPRMGNPASLIDFPAEARRDSALWFSLTPLGRDIIVTTNDRRVFSWPQDSGGAEATASFSAYLKARVAREIEAAALLGHPSATQTTAVIAADQRLKFLHLRPVLSALAAAGITSYAFETQTIIAATPHGASRAHGEHGAGEGRDE